MAPFFENLFSRNSDLFSVIHLFPTMILFMQTSISTLPRNFDPFYVKSIIYFTTQHWSFLCKQHHLTIFKKSTTWQKHPNILAPYHSWTHLMPCPPPTQPHPPSTSTPMKDKSLKKVNMIKSSLKVAATAHELTVLDLVYYGFCNKPLKSLTTTKKSLTDTVKEKMCSFHRRCSLLAKEKKILRTSWTVSH